MMDRWVTNTEVQICIQERQASNMLAFVFWGLWLFHGATLSTSLPPSLATLNPNFIHSLFLSLSVWLVRKFVFPFLGVDFLNDISGFDCKFQMITCHTMNKKKDVRYYMDLWIIVRGKSKANHRKFINRLNTLMIKQLDYLKDKYMETIEERCSMIHDLH